MTHQPIGPNHFLENLGFSPKIAPADKFDSWRRGSAAKLWEVSKRNEIQRNRIRMLVMAAAALIGIIGVVMWVASSREPHYQGKAEHVWLDEMYEWDGDVKYPAFQAFQAMGTKALPELLAIVQKDPSKLSARIDVLNWMQSSIKIPGGGAWKKNRSALWALYATGSNAVPVWPALTNMLFHRKSDFAEISIPPLLAAYPSADANGRVFIMVALAQFGPTARSAIPTMKAALTDRNSDVRHVAAFALKKIDPQNAGSVEKSSANHAL